MKPSESQQPDSCLRLGQNTFSKTSQQGLHPSFQPPPSCRPPSSSCLLLSPFPSPLHSRLRVSPFPSRPCRLALPRLRLFGRHGDGGRSACDGGQPRVRVGRRARRRGGRRDHDRGCRRMVRAARTPSRALLPTPHPRTLTPASARAPCNRPGSSTGRHCRRGAAAARRRSWRRRCCRAWC